MLLALALQLSAPTKTDTNQVHPLMKQWHLFFRRSAGRGQQRGAAASRRRYVLFRVHKPTKGILFVFRPSFHYILGSVWERIIGMRSRLARVVTAAPPTSITYLEHPVQVLHLTTRLTIDSPSSSFWSGDSISPSSGTSRMTSFMLRCHA